MKIEESYTSEWIWTFIDMFNFLCSIKLFVSITSYIPLTRFKLFNVPGYNVLAVRSTYKVTQLTLFLHFWFRCNVPKPLKSNLNQLRPKPALFTDTSLLRTDTVDILTNCWLIIIIVIYYSWIFIFNFWKSLKIPVF